MDREISPTPRLESRMKALENTQTILNAQIVELSQDMSESFRQQAAYQVQFERKVDMRFDRLEASIIDLKGDVFVLKEDVTTLKGDVTTLKGDVATLKGDVATLKGSITALEKQVSDGFQQLLAVINERLPSSK